ncbi:MAG: beta-lactamase family protein [Candidatus Nanopelagicales bacterium]|nr:beta-lactamase family protein [Candidatus Nanopelagicales bacterium]
MTRPTLDNWLLPENTFWSFRHVRELIPTAQIDCAKSPRVLNQKIKTELGGISIETHDGVKKISDFLSSTNTDSFTAVKGEDLVFEWLAPGVTDVEPHMIFSVTKSVTGMLVGALVQEGKIDVDALVTKYVPEIADSGFGDATVRNLLDMAASYQFEEDYTPGPDIIAYRHSVGWYPAPLGAPNLHDFIASRKKEGAHGQMFRYMSPTTDLVGWVIEAASGMPYAQALSKYIWSKIGTEAPAHITVDRTGAPRAAGGLSAIPRDLVRFGMMIRDGGMGAIDPEFMRDVYENGSFEQWQTGDFKDFLPKGVYRSFCYKPGEDPDVIMGIGIHGQMLYVDRPRGVVVAKQSSWPNPDSEEMHLDAFHACQAIARALG